MNVNFSRNIKNILFIALGALIGFCFCRLITPRCIAVPATASITAAPDAVLAETEKNFTERSTQLQHKNRQLSRELSSTRTALQQARQQSRLLQLRTRAMTISPDPADSLQDCDSLREAAIALIAQDQETDSLCATAVDILERQAAAKDAMIQLQTGQYDALRLTYEQGVVRQQSLADQNSLLQRQLRRQKTKSRLASIGVIVLSGVAAAFLASH